MELPELMELRTSNEAPYNHAEFTIWLHNIIIESVRRELMDTNNAHLTSLKSLKPIRNER